MSETLSRVSRVVKCGTRLLGQKEEGPSKTTETECFRKKMCPSVM